MTIRVGLFGTGPWARRAHGPGLAGHAGVELVGVWGRRPGAAAEVAAEFGGRAYPDQEALIADVDAVAIALPPALQAPLAAKAATAGRHLLLDKPLAATVEDAHAVADAVDAAGVASVVFFTLRFDAGSAAWIDRQAATGDWYTGRADWYGAVFGRPSPAASPYAASPWRQEKGGLWDVGPHALSVLLPVLGDVTEVHASRGAGDTTHLTLRHDSGASSTAVLTLTAPRPGPGWPSSSGARTGSPPTRRTSAGRPPTPSTARSTPSSRRSPRPRRRAPVRRALRRAGHRDPGGGRGGTGVAGWSGAATPEDPESVVWNEPDRTLITPCVPGHE